MGHEELCIVGGTLIDGNGGPPRADSMIHVAQGRIRAVGRRGDGTPPGARVIEADGQYVLPGFMNGNVHLLDGIMMMGKGGVEYLARFEGRLHEVIEEAAQIALKGGCTTVFDTWNATVPVLKARDRINEGRAAGARIFAAGNIIGMGGPFSADFMMQARASTSARPSPTAWTGSSTPASAAASAPCRRSRCGRSSATTSRAASTC